MTAKILLGVGAVALAVVLFLVLRPDDDDDGEANPTPATETTATTTEETTTEETTTEETTSEATTTEETTTEPAGPQRIAVRFANERVVGGVKSVAIERNSEVLLVVRSDVADHVHVHGYDLFSDVGPGQPTRIGFQAGTPGRFDVELEDRRVPLVVLEVQQ
jgi:hypothetical protein